MMYREMWLKFTHQREQAIHINIAATSWQGV